MKGRMSHPPENTWNLFPDGQTADDGQTNWQTKGQLSEHRYPAIPRPSRESLTNTGTLPSPALHEKASEFFSDTRKALPSSQDAERASLPHLLQVRSMYLHTPKSSTWFWLNRPRPQATSQTSTSSRPFTMVLHSYHADSDSPIHDQELAETFRALHNNKD